MPRNYLIVDVESTCWKDDRNKKAESEIIEIGAVLFAMEKKMAVDMFQSFIRPVRNPVLSTFCIKLTSIKQCEVDNAPLFPKVIEMLIKKFLYKQVIMLASWGEYDKNQLKKDCRFHKIEYPFEEQHLNIKQMFADKNNCNPCGMKQALRMLNIPLEGICHRGIDDAQNIAKILTAII